MELGSLRRPRTRSRRSFFGECPSESAERTRRRPDPKKNGSLKDPQWERYPRRGLVHVSQVGRPAQGRPWFVAAPAPQPKRVLLCSSGLAPPRPGAGLGFSAAPRPRRDHTLRSGHHKSRLSPGTFHHIRRQRELRGRGESCLVFAPFDQDIQRVPVPDREPGRVERLLAAVGEEQGGLLPCSAQAAHEERSVFYAEIGPVVAVAKHVPTVARVPANPRRERVHHASMCDELAVVPEATARIEYNLALATAPGRRWQIKKIGMIDR